MLNRYKGVVIEIINNIMKNNKKEKVNITM